MNRHPDPYARHPDGRGAEADQLQSVCAPIGSPSSALRPILHNTSGTLSSMTAVCTSTSIDSNGNAKTGMPTPIAPLTRPAIARLAARSAIKPGVAVSADMGKHASRAHLTATQSISTSNGPGHDGTCTKMRAGDSSGK